MKVLASFFVAAVLMACPAFADGGSSVKGGGKGVVIDGRLYALDLVDAGIERTVQIPVDLRRGYYTLGGSTFVEDAGNDSAKPQIAIVREPEGELIVHFIDSVEHATLDSILAKSGPENDFMFGRRLERKLCVTPWEQAPTNLCLDQKALLALVFTNQQAKEERANYLFLKWFKNLRWILVNAPLKKLDDDHSPVVDQLKYMLAERRDGVVRISRFGWEQPADLDGTLVQPLDLANQVALITHEAFYAMTANQGDSDSDRARMATASYWNYSSGANALPPASDILQTFVPKSKPAGEALLVSELPVGQVLELDRDIRIPKIDNALHSYGFLEGAGLIGMDHIPYASLCKPQIELLTENWHTFEGGAVLPKGTLLKIKEIHVEDKGDWYQADITFEGPSSRNSIHEMRITGADCGRTGVMPLSKFLDVTRGYMSLKL